MRIEDAPPPGWYPDPEGGSRLRWWEGTDWSDRYRSPPTAGLLSAGEQQHLQAVAQGRAEASAPWGQAVPGQRPPGTDQIIEQVRLATRAEAERAAQMFGAQARSAARDFTPLITEYTNKVVKWFRFASVVVILLVIGWIAFQVFAQVSMFEWIGDRIDNLTDNSGVIVGSRLNPSG